MLLRERGGRERETNTKMGSTELLTKQHVGDGIKENEMGRAYGTYGEKRNAYRILVGKPERMKPVRKPRSR
jgi:hypothetical protein